MFQRRCTGRDSVDGRVGAGHRDVVALARSSAVLLLIARPDVRCVTDKRVYDVMLPRDHLLSHDVTTRTLPIKRNKLAR